MSIPRIVVTAVTAAVLGTLAGNVANAVTAEASPRLVKMTPCVYEDGSGGPLPCYWDGTTRGNQTGASYWIDKHGRQHFTR